MCSSVWGGAMSSEIDKLLSGRLSRRELVKKAGVGAGGVMMAGLISACGGSSSTTTTAGSTAPTTTAAPPPPRVRLPPAARSRSASSARAPARRPASASPTPTSSAWPGRRWPRARRSAARPTPSRSSTRTARRTRRAAPQVAKDLINSDKVDLMLATSTPETVNPVADACEAAGVPCISTVVPWEAWYFGRGAKPGEALAVQVHLPLLLRRAGVRRRPTRACGRRCRPTRRSA